MDLSPDKYNLNTNTPSSNLGGVFDEEFIDFLLRKVNSELPEEKAKAKEIAAAIGRELTEDGSMYCDGLGQKMGSIDSRTYFRWNAMLPGCWNDKNFVSGFLLHNPQYCAPGYTTKRVAAAF